MTAPQTLESARAWAGFAYQRWVGNQAEPPDRPLDRSSLQRLGIDPYLYYALDDAGDDRAAEFSREYRHTTTANLIRLAHGARVRDALEARGVAPVLLKGGAFLVRFCPDTLGVRPMADLDLLVAPERQAAAEAVLHECGLQPTGDLTRRSRQRAHAWSFVSTSAPTPIDIDLHRGVAAWPVATDLTRRILTTHDRVGSWRVPRMADAICLTALHRARHAFVWSAVDFFELKRMIQGLDADGWRDVIDGAASAGLTGAVWASYRQAVWWLGASPEDDEHLESLNERLSAPRRRLLARMAAPEAVLNADSPWQGPLLRNFVVTPCAMTTPGRALLAAATFLPLRVAEEWTAAKRQGLGAAARLRRLWARTWHGAPREAAGRLP